jgi:hypothetical protein
MSSVDPYSLFLGPLSVSHVACYRVWPDSLTQSAWFTVDEFQIMPEFLRIEELVCFGLAEALRRHQSVVACVQADCRTICSEETRPETSPNLFKSGLTMAALFGELWLKVIPCRTNVSCLIKWYRGFFTGHLLIQCRLRNGRTPHACIAYHCGGTKARCNSMPMLM